MSKGLLFWIIMLIWLIFGLWVSWPPSMMAIGGSLMLFILLALLGWHCFGAPIQ